MVDQYTKKTKEQGPKVFSQDITGLSEKIKQIEPPEYRLLFEILNLPKNVRRVADYYSLKIKHFNRKTDNYITVGGKLVFNHTVKTHGLIDVQLPDDLVKLCKQILPPLRKKRDTLFSGSQNVYNKATSKISTELGITGGSSQFRKIQYQNPQNKDDLEAHKRIQAVADASGHSLETVINHYS